jgi:hypothetical protein
LILLVSGSEGFCGPLPISGNSNSHLLVQSFSLIECVIFLKKLLMHQHFYSYAA